MSGVRRAAPLAVGVAVMAFAALLCAAAGRRGLFALDQSILFDAGHRILSGQTPFADFRLPVGPVAPALQALFFGLLGVSFATYVASAAVANAAAAGLALLLLRRLLPERPGLAALGGLLTAIWFYPPSGTPWFGPTAFLFVLAGVVLLLPALCEGVRGARAGALAAGACAVAAGLTKQNAGAAALPLFALLLGLPLAEAGLRGGRAALRPALAPLALFLAGAAAAAAAFAVWLAALAEPEVFLRHAVEIPAAEGLRRLAAPTRAFAAAYGEGLKPEAARLVLLGCALLAPGAGVLAARRRRGEGAFAARRRLAAALLAPGLLLAQRLFQLTSRNQPEIAAPFAGLLVPLAAGLLLELGPARAPRRRGGALRLRAGLRVAVGVGAAAAALLLGARGIEVALSRSVHDVFPEEVRFERSLRASGLEALRWGRPTRLRGPEHEGPVDVAAADVERLVAALEARPGRFFVFPDWTLLYGVLGRPAPQPLLWFHAGLTYPADAGAARSALDAGIVASLERHRVRTVVVERVSWLGTGRRLADLPRLAAYLERCYATLERIGPFELRGRRRACPLSAEPAPGPPGPRAHRAASASAPRHRPSAPLR